MATKTAPKPTSTSRFRKRKYGKNHAYYLRQADGSEVKLDGVTTILSNGIPKPALVYWAANSTSDYATDHWDELAELPLSKRNETLRKSRYAISDEAKARGTEVHDLAERIAHGEEVEVPTEIRGHVESAVKFLDEFEVEVILTETSVFHDRALYGGTFDLLLRSKLFPGRVILADWKTNRTGIYPETALQLTAYAKATHYLDAEKREQLISELGITDTWAVWIRSDGYEVYDMECSDDTWAAFAHAAGVARSISDKEVAETWKSAPLRPRVAA